MKTQSEAGPYTVAFHDDAWVICINDDPIETLGTNAVWQMIGRDQVMELNAAYAAGQKAANADLLAACEARLVLDRTVKPCDRWQVRIGDVIDSKHDSRGSAYRRREAIRRAAIAKAKGGAA